MHFKQATLYGIDWNAPLGTDSDEVEAVEIPATSNPLISSDFSQLQQLIHPTSESDNHGIDQYLATIRFVESKVSQY